MHIPKLKIPIQVEPEKIPEDEENKAPEDAVYRVKRCDLKQPRYIGRDVLEPDIDLSDYRCNAVVDWITITFYTHKEHQAKNIHKRLNEVYAHSLFVSGPDAKKRYQGKEFLITLQTPDAANLVQLLRALRSYPDRRTETRFRTRIHAIEISIDFYPYSGDANDRIRMTDVLRRHLMPDPLIWAHENGIPRTVYGKFVSGG